MDVVILENVNQFKTFQFVNNLNGIKATSSLPTFSPILDPRTEVNFKVTVIRIKVMNVHIQASG